ncbi:hypothetical protein P3S67_018214 [Capsicum chacoense]
MSLSSRTIYVGNLLGGIREQEVEDLFYKYGAIADIDIKFHQDPLVMLFLGLKRLVILMMLFEGVMAMILMGIA